LAGYSYDKRWSPSPYLDGLEVGHYDAGKQQVRRHFDSVDACADFVLTEVRWVVDRRVVEHRSLARNAGCKTLLVLTPGAQEAAEANVA
jgi:hypothetical protein